MTLYDVAFQPHFTIVKYYCLTNGMAAVTKEREYRYAFLLARLMNHPLIQISQCVIENIKGPKINQPVQSLIHWADRVSYPADGFISVYIGYLSGDVPSVKFREAVYLFALRILRAHLVFYFKNFPLKGSAPLTDEQIAAHPIFDKLFPDWTDELALLRKEPLGTIYLKEKLYDPTSWTAS